MREGVNLISPVDVKEVERHANKILIGLSGHYNDFITNDERGKFDVRNDSNSGIYEHKLASMLEYPMHQENCGGEITNVPPPIFFEATKMLKDRGYASRRDGKQGFPIKRI
jgi:hypothetical protein